MPASACPAVAGLPFPRTRGRSAAPNLSVLPPPDHHRGDVHTCPPARPSGPAPRGRGPPSAPRNPGAGRASCSRGCRAENQEQTESKYGRLPRLAAQVRGLEGGESAGKPDSVGPLTDRAVIHLGSPLPTTSVRSTRGLGRAALDHPRGDPEIPFSTLLRVGFTEPAGSLRPLVVSYTTVSPLPPRTVAVCSLWHCPAGRPGSVLPTTLPCGVRTFLGSAHPARSATAWPTPLDARVYRRRPGPGPPVVRSRWEVSLNERITIGPSA
ncbi:hypothetical protein SAMN05421803_11330 [Nocardiopsis flavescens]|uniref:Uncharacterized protein n=1 Tax=Nocardiopsis flavescens TaxID=758803 RepID=A0A1M6PD21_9ACTN|nr:hypothetical protein SAMN05421803_11330 [Nocardiopsis flavescens]